MKTLECSSAGNKNFSAFYATVRIRDVVGTIEELYQASKRDTNNQPCAKGAHVHHCIINGVELPASYLTAWYRYLWYTYLRDNPQLVRYARQFDAFTDKFRGRAINCQADCVKAYVERDSKFYNPILELVKIAHLPFQGV